ncbi:hypothetical protein INR49_009625, partial [Caranx melampygus]
MSVLRCLCASVRRHVVSPGLSLDRVFAGCSRAASGAVKDKQPLKKAKTPQEFPDDVNPVTKEKGGPRGPEPTRYGDWERKGRCGSESACRAQAEWRGQWAEKHLGISRRNQTNMNLLTRPREEVTPQSLSHSLRDISPPSATSDDLGSPLGVSELRGRLDREEPTVGLPFYASKSTQRRLFSSILDVQRLNPPQRPQLTSTVLNPTYTPRSGHSRSGQMEERGGEENRLSSSGKHSKGGSMSPYQAKYWACAIPKTLPPSPDRHSAHWDPNKEYQALLDYTYPLRPGEGVSEWASSELQEDSLQQTHLQDSGIELDHLCSSTSLSGLDLSLNSTGQTRERSPADVGNRSPDLLGFTRSSDGLPSSTQLPLPDPAGLSLVNLDCSLDRGGPDHYKSGDDLLHWHGARAPPSSTSTSSAFIYTTCLFPQPRYACGEVDEEFRPLPEQLEELHQLSRQVREMTAKLTRPVTASWESLEQGNASILSSITLPEKQEDEDEDKVDDSQDTDQGKHEPVGEESTLQTAAAKRDSEAVRRASGALVEPVEAVFCSHLERLIQQLYTVSEKMDIVGAPTADIDSVKSSLAEYQSFQRAVSSHQPLASCVLHTGHLLLNCINTTSPPPALLTRSGSVQRSDIPHLQRRSVLMLEHPPDEGLTVVPGVSFTLGFSPPPAVAPGPILFLISAAIVMKACSTLVAFLALVSKKGMPR